MSMISGQVDRLRTAAQTYRRLGNHSAESMLLDAADTIWQLRDDLQRANDAVRDVEHDESRAWDRVRKAEAENAKLRELATYALKHIIEFECEVPDSEMLRGKPCEDCADYGSSDCPKCMPRMFDVSGIEVDE